ncbi:MAG: hypothetical protein R3174_04615 [Gammaproteobacteria bacterium]|nr:hypothetical protein [Gammaproteobacteria bacterium]
MVNRSDDIDDPRRRILVKALTLGIFSAAFPRVPFGQQLFGNLPQRLPPNRSIYRMTGTVLVNGTPASTETRIFPGDIVSTGPDSEVIFVVGGHAMILRSNTQLTIEARQQEASMLISGLRMLTGKLLSVSRESQVQLMTQTASVGIRGTGWYAEAEPDQTYFCTCYGATDIASSADPQSRTTVVSQHHDRPVYILADAAQGQAIRDAPFINHTDQELALIEALVGREPPFVFFREDYIGPQREY